MKPVSKDWLSLREAARLTGLDAQAIKALAREGSGIRVKKLGGRGRERWGIHRDDISLLPAPAAADKTPAPLNPPQAGPAAGLVTLEYYDAQRKEWEMERLELEKELLQYRIKFGEAERRLHLLPEFPEVLAHKMRDLLESTRPLRMELVDKESIITSLQAELEKEKDNGRDKERICRELTELLQDARQSRDELMVRAKEMEEKNRELLSAIESLEASQAESRAKSQKLEEKFRELSARVQKVIARRWQNNPESMSLAGREEWEMRVSVLEEQCVQLTTQMEDARESQGELERYRDALEKRCEDMAARIEESKAERLRLEEQASRQKEVLETQARQLEAAAVQMEAQVSVLADVQAKLTGTEGELADSRKALQQAEEAREEALKGHRELLSKVEMLASNLWEEQEKSWYSKLMEKVGRT
jgi:chromosome segregation ATPase